MTKDILLVLSFFLTIIFTVLPISFVLLRPTKWKSSPNLLHSRILVWSRQIVLVSMCVNISVNVVQLRDHISVWNLFHLSYYLYIVSMILLCYFDDVKRLYDDSFKRSIWIPLYLWISVNAYFLNYCRSQQDFWLILTLITSSITCLLLSIISLLYNPYVNQVHPPTDEYTSNILSYLTFSYVSVPLIDLKNRKELIEIEDLPHLPEHDMCRLIWDKLDTLCHEESFKDQEKNNHKDSFTQKSLPKYKNLAWYLFSIVYYEWMEQGIFHLLSSCSMFISPLALERILSSLSNSTDYSIQSILPMSVEVAVALLFIAPIFQAIGDGQCFARGRHIGIRVKSALIAAIYRKALVTDSSVLAAEGTGNLSNLISVDAGAIQSFMCYSHFIWTCPFEIALCICLLFVVLGVSAAGGLVVMVMAIPLGYYVGKRLEFHRDKLLSYKDKRVDIVSEVLNSLRIIKLCVWEENFLNKISEARSIEMKSLRAYLFTNASLMVLWEALPALVTFSAFLLHTAVLGRRLSPAMGFTALTLFNQLRFPLMVFPEMINDYIQTKISLQRIKKFLNNEEAEGLKLVGEYYEEDSARSDAKSSSNDSLPVPSTSLQQSSTEEESVAIYIDNRSWPTPSSRIILNEVSFGWNLHVDSELSDLPGTSDDQDTPSSPTINHLSERFCGCLFKRVFGKTSQRKRHSRRWRETSPNTDHIFCNCCFKRKDSPQLESINPMYARILDPEQQALEEGVVGAAGPVSGRLRGGSQLVDEDEEGGVSVGWKSVSSGGGRRSRSGSDHSRSMDGPLEWEHEGRLSHNHVIQYDSSIQRNPLNSDVLSPVSSPLNSVASQQPAIRVVVPQISLDVPEGGLTVIVGPTGCGKSTLLAGLLGECKTLSGSMRMPPGIVAYVSQTAWIQNATVRDNILFGSNFEPKRYAEVIMACALDADLRKLPSSDLTEIGERGVNLSGGQQQRVALARAAYNSSSIVFLDDPLSAVDAHVAQHIYRKLICGFLRNRTRILVSHQVSLALSEADLVLCLARDGTVLACCPPSSLKEDISKNFSLYGMLAKSSPSIQDFLISQDNEVKNSITVETKSQNESDSREDKFARQEQWAPPMSSVSAEGSSSMVSRESQPSLETQGSNSTSISKLDSISGKASSFKESEEGDGCDQGASIKEGLGDHNMIIQAEVMTTGEVGWQVYWSYVKAAGGVLIFGILIASCITMSAIWVSQSYYLGHWMSEMESGSISPWTGASGFYLKIYILLTIFYLIIIATRAIIQALAASHASQAMHDRLAESLMQAPISWLEATPVGRIVNRFSQDISTLDTDLMARLIDFLDCFLGALQIFGVVAMSLQLMLPPLIFIGAIGAYVARKYFAISRELKRLESIHKSPVFVLLAETLNGMPVIRAFGAQSRFFATLCDRVDQMNRCHLYLWISNRWLNVRMQLLGALVSGTTALFVYWYGKRIGNTAAGLVLVYALNFSDALTYLARAHADCQMNLNSVERILEYCSISPEKYHPSISKSLQEKSSLANETAKTSWMALFSGLFWNRNTQVVNPLSDEEIVAVDPLRVRKSTVPTIEDLAKDSLIPSTWPSKGDIVFENVTMRYPTSERDVLKGINLRIAGGSKVGVVGRTGSGKSSLLAALFRMVEPSGESKIFIDEVNIMDLPLHTLRSALAIVPQSPILFQGSVRSNLDPFNKMTDDVLWAALRKVHMADHVQNMQSSPTQNSDRQTYLPPQAPTTTSTPFMDIKITNTELETDSGPVSGVNPLYLANLDEKPVLAGGANFSAGQRQLLCLARAAVRGAKILVLDEATANVDPDTDALIQDTVRNEFQDCTVIGIAHRLRTITACDYVVVLDDGCLKELDSPEALLQNTSSNFFQMCQKSGELEVLRQMIQDSKDSQISNSKRKYSNTATTRS